MSDTDWKKKCQELENEMILIKGISEEMYNIWKEDLNMAKKKKAKKKKKKKAKAKKKKKR